MAKVTDSDLILEANKKVVAEKVVARSSDGLLLEDDGGNYIKLLDGGIIDISKQSCARAYLSTNQTIPNITYTKVNLNSESFDVQGEFDISSNYRFTASKAGRYIVIGQLCLYSMGDGDKVYTNIYKNGNIVARTINEQGSASSTRYGVAKILYLAANDYVELWAYHSYGDVRSAYAGTNNTFLAVHKLS